MDFFVDNRKGRLQEFFLINTTRITHLRELSRLTGISFPWTRKLVSELTKEGFLIRTKERGLILVNANRENKLFISLKRGYNIFSLQKSGLVDTLSDIYRRPEAIVAFGSYSRGEDIEKSDIDIAVISEIKISHELSKFEQRLHRTIKVLTLQRGHISEEFLNTLANGIVMEGYMELR